MTIKKLTDLWEKFGNIAINNNDEIESQFLHFEKGTDRFEIWHWFEEQNPRFSVGKIVKA